MSANISAAERAPGCFKEPKLLYFVLFRGRTQVRTLVEIFQSQCSADARKYAAQRGSEFWVDVLGSGLVPVAELGITYAEIRKLMLAAEIR